MYLLSTTYWNGCTTVNSLVPYVVGHYLSILISTSNAPIRCGGHNCTSRNNPLRVESFIILYDQQGRALRSTKVKDGRN